MTQNKIRLVFSVLCLITSTMCVPAQADFDTSGERNIFPSEKKILLLGFSSEKNIKQYEFLNALIEANYRNLDYVGAYVPASLQPQIDAYLENSDAALPDLGLSKSQAPGVTLVLENLRKINTTRHTLDLAPIRLIATNCKAGCPINADGMLENNEQMVERISTLTHGYKGRGIISMGYSDAARTGYGPPRIVQKMLKTTERISTFHSVLAEKIEDKSSIVSVWLQAPDTRLQDYGTVLPEWVPLFKITRKYQGRYVMEIDTQDKTFLEYEKEVGALENTGLQISKNFDYFVRIPSEFSMGSFCNDLMGAPLNILRGKFLRKYSK